MNIPFEVLSHAQRVESATKNKQRGYQVIAEWAFERAAVEAWNHGMKYAPGSQHEALMEVPGRIRALKDLG